MAYDEYLVERLENSLKQRGISFTNKKMMGGMLFMVDEKMFMGLNRDKNSAQDRIMVRIGEEAQEMYKKRTGCVSVEFTGRPMKGFVFVYPEGFDMDDDWEFWVEMALKFNPKAKKSK